MSALTVSNINNKSLLEEKLSLLQEKVFNTEHIMFGQLREFENKLMEFEVHLQTQDVKLRRAAQNPVADGTFASSAAVATVEEQLMAQNQRLKKMESFLEDVKCVSEATPASNAATSDSEQHLSVHHHHKRLTVLESSLDDHGPQIRENHERLTVLESSLDDNDAQTKANHKRLQDLETSLEDMHAKLANSSSGYTMEPVKLQSGPDTNNIEMLPKTACVTVMGEDLDNDGIPDILQNQEDKPKGDKPKGDKLNGEQVAAGNDSGDYESGFEYEQLEESIWDTILFIGLPQTGFLGSVYVAMLVILNAFTQLSLCVIINDVFTTPEVSSQHALAMRKWRVSFGHSTDLMNKFTHQSFIAKVCNSPLSTQMHTSAAALMDRIGEYLPLQEDYDLSSPFLGPILPYWKGIGMSMSLLAIIVWSMQISINIQKISHKRWAFKTLPVGARTVLVHKGDDGQFVCISMGRKVFAMLVLLVELLVVVLLCFAGIFYIIRTLSMRDLLLNCSALSIVLEIDELFFTAMVPHRSRYLLTSLKPLPRPLSHNFKGMSWSSLFSVVLIGVIVTLSALELQSQAGILEDTRHEICGGNINFVARPDDAGVLAASHVEPSDNLEDSYYYHTMRSLVKNDNDVHRWFSQSGSAATSGVQGGPWSLMAWTNMGLDTTVTFWNSKCIDLLPVSSGVHAAANYFLHMLQDVVKDYSIQDCADVQKYCNTDTVEGVRTRAICPITCGCNHAGPRLVLGGNHGCPNTCYTSEVYNASMWSRECEDLPLDSPYWAEFGRGFNDYLNGYIFWTNGDDLSAEMISERGCNLVSEQHVIFGVPWNDLCEIHASYMKPLTYACPVSCQCKTRHRSMCPNKCGLPA